VGRASGVLAFGRLRSWTNSLDVAVYPALFADYSGFCGLISRPSCGALALGFIWLLTGQPGRHQVVGRSAVALARCALAPVAVLTAAAASQARFVPWMPFTAESQACGRNRPRARSDDAELPGWTT
jgi:hypothetical protein